MRGGYVKLEQWRFEEICRSLPLFQLAVGDECEGGGDGAERVVAGAAEERPDAFDAIDLLEAVQVPFVAALAEGRCASTCRRRRTVSKG